MNDLNAPLLDFQEKDTLEVEPTIPVHRKLQNQPRQEYSIFLQKLFNRVDSLELNALKSAVEAVNFARRVMLYRCIFGDLSKADFPLACNALCENTQFISWFRRFYQIYILRNCAMEDLSSYSCQSPVRNLIIFSEVLVYDVNFDTLRAKDVALLSDWKGLFPTFAAAHATPSSCCGSKAVVYLNRIVSRLLQMYLKHVEIKSAKLNLEKFLGAVQENQLEKEYWEGYKNRIARLQKNRAYYCRQIMGRAILLDPAVLSKSCEAAIDTDDNFREFLNLVIEVYYADKRSIEQFLAEEIVAKEMSDVVVAFLYPNNWVKGRTAFTLLTRCVRKFGRSLMNFNYEVRSLILMADVSTRLLSVQRETDWYELVTYGCSSHAIQPLV